LRNDAIVTPLQKVAGEDAKSGGSIPPEVAAKPMNRTYEEEPITLSGTLARAHEIISHPFSENQTTSSQRVESQKKGF
jgi:hypothetical protein